MKLREFIENLKNFKPGKEITDMPAHNKVDPTKCAICKKSFKEGEKEVVSDVSGTQFHQACFDKSAGNDELKKRRTDNQLPEDTLEEGKEEATTEEMVKYINKNYSSANMKELIMDMVVGHVLDNVEDNFRQRKDVKEEDILIKTIEKIIKTALK